MAASSITSKLVHSLSGSLGFWRTEAKREIKECVSDAMLSGMTEEQACALVARVWRVAASEYGE